MVQRESPTWISFVGYALQWVGLLCMINGLLDISPIMAPFEPNGQLDDFKIGFVLYIQHLFQSMCRAKTAAYLRNIMSEKEFAQHIDGLQQADPKINFHIECYHMETRTRTVSDGNGGTRTESYQEKVVTHTAAMVYPVAGFVDETLSPAQTMAMFHLLHDGTRDLSDVEAGTHVEKQKRRMFLLCHFTIDFQPASEGCEQEFNQRRESFYQQNTRDTHQTKTEKRNVDGFREHVLVILTGGTDDTTDRPLWMNNFVYLLSVICMVSIPYRLFLFSQCTLNDWTILKHFSAQAVETWETPIPMRSRRKAKDAAGGAFRALPRETGPRSVEGGEVNPHMVGRSHVPALHVPALHVPAVTEADPDNYLDVSLVEALPEYWKSKDMSENFDIKVRLNDKELVGFQQMVDGTFIAKATRDRQDAIASSFKVSQVLRIEDLKLWKRYQSKRAELAALPRPKLIEHFEGTSGQIKTAPFSCSADGASFLTAPGINEAYLFHGSSPAGALGIGETGFDLSMVGTNVGTMFGGGAYFAEACSKSDEYAQDDPTGLFAGKYALLLCRVLLGSTFRVTESNIPAIEAALATGHYQSVLGDREAAVGTYREFVVFDEAQIYPEYVIIYERVVEEYERII